MLRAIHSQENKETAREKARLVAEKALGNETLFRCKETGRWHRKNAYIHGFSYPVLA